MSPRPSTTAGLIALTIAAVCRSWQVFAVPSPPLKLGSAGAQATSPAAATTTVPPVCVVVVPGLVVVTGVVVVVAVVVLGAVVVAGVVVVATIVVVATVELAGGGAAAVVVVGPVGAGTGTVVPTSVVDGVGTERPSRIRSGASAGCSREARYRRCGSLVATTRLALARWVSDELRSSMRLHRRPRAPGRRARPMRLPTLGASVNASDPSSQAFEVAKTSIDVRLAARRHSFS